MIPKELLLSKGAVNAIQAMYESGPQTVTELAETANLSESTVRRRLDELADNELVELDAQLRDGSAVRTHRLTTRGEDMGYNLLTLIDESDPEPPARPENDRAPPTPDETQETSTNVSQTSESDDGKERQSQNEQSTMRPEGVSFGGSE